LGGNDEKYAVIWEIMQSNAKANAEIGPVGLARVDGPGLLKIQPTWRYAIRV
jgi:hypothetical protein